MTTRKKEVWLRKNHCRKTLDDEEEGDGSGEYVDEEVENAIVNCTPSAPTTTGGGSNHKTIPWGRKFPLSVLPLALTLLRIYRIILTVRPQHENHHHRPRLPRRKSNTDVTAKQRLSSSATATNNAPPAPKRRMTETGASGFFGAFKAKVMSPILPSRLPSHPSPECRYRFLYLIPPHTLLNSPLYINQVFLTSPPYSLPNE